PAPTGDRPWPGHRAAPARARRARRGHERHREARPAQAARIDPQVRRDAAADRARREAGDGALRPRAGPRLWPQHRRGSPARHPAGPARDRGLPRHRSRNTAAPGAGARMSLLRLEQLQVSYGGIRAVKGIDIEVRQGELVCLIGANGAGKTTTLRAVTGLVRAAAGRVLYEGQGITGLRVPEIARRGLALVPEGRGVFAQLTIEENLAMGAYARSDRAGVAADVERVFALFPRLKE